MTFSVNSGLPNKPVYQPHKKTVEPSKEKAEEVFSDDLTDKLDLQFSGLVSNVLSDGPDLSEAEAKNLSYLLGLKLSESGEALMSETSFSDAEMIEFSLELGERAGSDDFLTDAARQALSVVL